MKSIYLAGHSIEFEYRKYCIDNYSDEFVLLDPIGRSLDVLKKNDWDVDKIASGEISIADEDIAFIVEEDKKDILKCDYLLAYVKKPTFGTVMEIMYAYEKYIPIIAVNPNGDWKGDIWLKYHACVIVNTLDEAFEYIQNIEKLGDIDE